MALRVIVIDDNELDLLYARIVLERTQPAIEVQTFDSARDALLALQGPADPPDLILLDINMPGMNGFEFLAAQKALSEASRAGAPVVMLTSSPDAQDRERAFAFAAVRGYLIKPIDIAAAAPWLQRPAD